MYDVGVIEQEVLDLILDERDKGKTDKQIRIIIDGAIDNAFDWADDVV